jgi:ABC-type glycerol-3-phosphate transport system substrate-binding protein
VDGLENLFPYIREHADTVNFLDINEASRSTVSYNGTVRALPLDTDYISIGWRQDVFHKHGLPLTPPQTIEELADLSERLNGLD